ncbi:O-antigen ligase domain-containing protein [Euzebyella marina]|uniref:O-antigen ligase domain-containing protein n=1 Tax=Euzebyella marina TaxID=1761453 RepID=A0A3G2L1H6_9FLAO|nr:O-antigen ligase family protein [Euzebyella marina]AYN66095.1 O-antigen ligase domain-containing protein [Euzebyella marina]
MSIIDPKEADRLRAKFFGRKNSFFFRDAGVIMLFFFAFFLPLYTVASNFFLIVFMVVMVYGIIEGGVRNRSDNVGWKMLVFTPFTFFILHIIGLGYSESPVLGLSYLERSLSFLLVPLILLFATPKEISFLRVVFLKGLILGTSISLLVLITTNLYRYFSAQESFHIGLDLFDYYHTYLKFTQPLNQHPTYLGVYYLTAIIFADEILHNRQLKYMVVGLFGLGFLFLNSRIIFIMLLLLLFFCLARAVKKMILGRKLLKLIVLSFAFLLGITMSIDLISKSYIGSRIRSIFKFEMSSQTEVKFNSHSKSNPRMARYISATELIKNRPFFGYGTTGERINLKRQFTKDGLNFAVDQNYNSHNQFLGYAVRYGVIGLGALFFFFGGNFYLAWSKRNKHYLFVVLLIAYVCLVENYFDRNFGITFSAVFFTIFSYQSLIGKRAI